MLPVRGVLFASLCATLITAAPGCGMMPIREKVHLRVAGAQIPVELVGSWLSDSKKYRFDLMPAGKIYLSSHGFDALRRGEVDLACTDRVIDKRELDGFTETQPVGYRVAYYGYGLYVNRQNTLDAIFSKHLSLAFQKRITDWKQLGGPEGPIRLYGPPKSTRGGMLASRQARIWFAEATWEVCASAEEIVQKVADDPFGLGFAPIGYDGDVRYLGLRLTRRGDAAFPSLEEIETDKYGLAKVIYVWVMPDGGRGVEALIDYLFSDQGRAVIESTHLWPIAAERAVVDRAR